MNFEEIAEGLIQAVGGIVCPTNINGTVDVLKGVMTGVHLQWEEYLLKTTNEALLKCKTSCPVCSNVIQVDRRVLKVDVKNA